MAERETYPTLRQKQLHSSRCMHYVLTVPTRGVCETVVHLE
jgi:hypothetical protein